MECSRIKRKLPSLLNCEVADKDKALISCHLDSCHRCRDEFARLEQLGAELDLVKDVEVRPYFQARLKQRIADRTRNRRSGWWRRVLVPTGAAAVCVVAAFSGTRLGRVAYAIEASRTAAGVQAQLGLDLLDGTGDGSMTTIGDAIFAGGSGE
jgi:predicted anti-sigma-YlaC factor YlaD